MGLVDPRGLSSCHPINLSTSQPANPSSFSSSSRDRELDAVLSSCAARVLLVSLALLHAGAGADAKQGRTDGQDGLDDGPNLSRAARHSLTLSHSPLPLGFQLCPEIERHFESLNKKRKNEKKKRTEQEQDRMNTPPAPLPILPGSRVLHMCLCVCVCVWTAVVVAKQRGLNSSKPSRCFATWQNTLRAFEPCASKWMAVVGKLASLVLVLFHPTLLSFVDRCCVHVGWLAVWLVG
ncbi:hypothetical protein BD289DRAFT_215570 [Coniella lustricola]|uniref:Uncharacterized protein n=1 Tax=Coniella lustricola TaxID=2025994 RepID=A0A2T2ZS39_9PEZI|nr:hypothetical protein BD289DRAFT_215570 [Coniella lustricola]